MLHLDPVMQIDQVLGPLQVRVLSTTIRFLGRFNLRDTSRSGFLLLMNVDESECLLVPL